MSDVPGPARDYVGYGPTPPRVSWPGGAHLAVNLVVNHEEGSEYSMERDGRNEGLGELMLPPLAEHRDFHMESIYEYGSRAGIWRLLRVFAELDVRATFVSCAEALERNPASGPAIVDGGHELACHGYRWVETWGLDRDADREQIRASIETFQRLCGRRPVGWLSRFNPTPWTRELLVEDGGFLYDSDAFNDDLPYFVEVAGRRHLVVPYTDVYNDGRYVVPQGFASPGDFVDAVTRGMRELLHEGRAGAPKMMSIGLHPRWAGQAARASALREVIEAGLAEGDVWFATRQQIAEHWIAQVGG